MKHGDFELDDGDLASVTRFHEKWRGVAVIERGSPSRDDDYASRVRSLGLTETDVVKVTHKKGFALKFHPTLPFIAAGDTGGQIGLWNFDTAGDDDDERVVVFDSFHGGRPVSALEWIDGALVSAGYDSVVRKCDFQHTSVLLADYASIPEVGDLGHAALLDATGVVLGAHDDGSLSLLDPRVATDKLVDSFRGHDGRCSHVAVGNPNLVATSSSADNAVRVFDLRAALGGRKNGTTARPVFDFTEHSRGVRGCAFHGRALASASYDNTVAIVENIHDGTVTRVQHNNETGRWLTPFKPVFDPHAPRPTVVLGSLDRPRRVDLIAASTSSIETPQHSPLPLTSCLVHTLHDDDQNMHAVTSLHDVHPRRHLIAGLNNSGRVCLWRQKKNL